MHVPLSNIPGRRAYVKSASPIRPLAGEERHHG